MVKNIKKVIKEINNKINLEQNLSILSNNLITSYYNYSMVRLTINYFTYYEVITESTKAEEKEISKNLVVVNDIIKNNLLKQLDPLKRQDVVKSISDIRDEIIKKMKVLTTYTDILQIYEHVLNRIEYKFVDEFIDKSDEELAEEIVSYIFSNKDTVVINDKIKDVIGQLPVRLTKAKYFDYISDSLSLYKTAQKSSINDFVYMIRSSAMLDRPEGFGEYFPVLYSFYLELKDVNYKDLEKNECKNLSDKIKLSAEYISSLVNMYVQLQELVNDLYVILLSEPYILEEVGEDSKVCKRIISEINKNYENKSSDIIDESIAELLTLLEGRQEAIYEEYAPLESVLFDIKTNHMELVQSLMLSNIYNCMFTIEMLLSTSIFIELDELKPTDIADFDYVENVKNNLIKELTEVFSQNPMVVNRAIMSNTLNKLPVFFVSSQDTKNYIVDSLKQCNNKAEKTASINIIREYMY